MRRIPYGYDLSRYHVALPSLALPLRINPLGNNEALPASGRRGPAADLKAKIKERTGNRVDDSAAAAARRRRWRWPSISGPCDGRTDGRVDDGRGRASEL